MVTMNSGGKCPSLERLAIVSKENRECCVLCAVCCGLGKVEELGKCGKEGRIWLLKRAGTV
jgi:hypothetical protein